MIVAGHLIRLPAMFVMMSTTGTPRIRRLVIAPMGRIREMPAAVRCIVAAAPQLGLATRGQCGTTAPEGPALLEGSTAA